MSEWFEWRGRTRPPCLDLDRRPSTRVLEHGHGAYGRGSWASWGACIARDKSDEEEEEGRIKQQPFYSSFLRNSSSFLNFTNRSEQVLILAVPQSQHQKAPLDVNVPRMFIILIVGLGRVLRRFSMPDCGSLILHKRGARGEAVIDRRSEGAGGRGARCVACTLPRRDVGRSRLDTGCFGLGAILRGYYPRNLILPGEILNALPNRVF